jgi:hypothetical protein
MTSSFAQRAGHRHEHVDLGRAAGHGRGIAGARIARQLHRVAFDQDLRVADHDEQISDALSQLGCVVIRVPRAVGETLAQRVRRNHTLIEWARDAANDQRVVDVRRQRRGRFAPRATIRALEIE